MTKSLFFLLLAAGLAATGYAQPEPQPLPRPDDVPERFTHITDEDGLVDGQTTAVVQDRQGFMWIGTWSGLERFDGYGFKHYSYDPEAAVNPPGEVIALHMDEDGVMWIGQRRGFSRFDPSTEVFTHFVHDPDDLNSPLPGSGLALYRGRSRNLWIGTERGFSQFDPSTARFTRYVHDEDDPASLPPGRVRAVYEDRDGVLWAGTEAGLSRLDPATQTFTHFVHDPGDPRSLSPGQVESIYEDRDGVLWVGAWGLNRFDRQTGTFERFFPDPRYLHWEHMAEQAPVNNIRAIYEDRDGALWVGCSWGLGSNGGGLYRFDRRTGAFTPYGQGPSGPHSLVDDHVEGIYQDLQGGLWIATPSGVSRMDRTARGFRLYAREPDNPNGLRSTHGPFVDRQGMLWIGRGTLSRFDRATGVVTHFEYDEADPDKAPGWIHAIHEDKDGTMWFGTYGNGLYRFDRSTETFTRYAHDPDDPESLGSPVVTAVLEDQQGTLWVGGRSSGGVGLNPGTVSRFDRATGRFTRYALGRSGLNTMYEDQAGVLWIGHEQGISRMHFGDEDTTTVGNNDRRSATTPVTFMHYALSVDVSEGVSHNSAWSIAERTKEPGILWIATNGGGLIRFDTRTERFERFIEQSSGLDNNFITNILADGNGRLWMSTSGITRFDPDTGVFRTYDSDDGLPYNDYVWLSAHRSRAGELFFSGGRGLTAFFPEDVADNPHAPEVAFTGLRLFNEPVVPGPESPLKTSLARTEAITLRHHQNDVSFDYVGLHFSNPAKNQYQYMLEGYDAAWREVGTLREATYTNLPPGAYTFHVKAANSDGLWNEEGTALKITILPPWWRTVWAYMLYALLLIAAVVGAFRLQHKRIVHREQQKAHHALEEAYTRLDDSHHQLEEAHHDLEQTHQHLRTTQKQLVQSEKMASLGALTAGIAHEIKNPLNFVNNFAEVNEELADELRQAWHNGKSDVEDLLDDLKQNASVIAQHGKRADAIVQSMMQHASGGSGEREPTEVNALVGEYVELAYHGKRAQTPGFRVEIDRDLGAEVGRVEMVSQEIGRVLLNLLSNAFDAVAEAEQPRVQVATRRINGRVEIRVRDNGSGIASEISEKIFEPFFTTKPTGSGTGLGLSLAYDIVVQGHGGTLEVESAEGEGATFTVTLPR